MASARIGSDTQMMQHNKPGGCGPIEPLDWRKNLPFVATAASDRLGWTDLEAARYSAEPAFEINPPALTHHALVLFTRPPEELDLIFEGVKRHVPPPPDRSRWCRPARRPYGAGAGDLTGSSSSWNRDRSRESPPRHSASTRRG
jgi:hypothetical protein